MAEHRRYGALPRGRRRRGSSGPGHRARVDVGARALHELHVRLHVGGGRLGPQKTTERRGGELPRGGHRARSRELRPERRGGVEHREVPSDEPRGEGPGRDPRRPVEPRRPSRAACLVDGKPGGEEVSIRSLDKRPGPERPEQGLVHELLIHGVQHELGDGVALPGKADDARAARPSGGNGSTVRIEVGRRRQPNPLGEWPHRVKRIRRELRGGRDAGVAHHGAVRGRETLAQRAVPLSPGRFGSGRRVRSAAMHRNRRVVQELRQPALAAPFEREVRHDHGRQALERARHGEDAVRAVPAVVVVAGCSLGRMRQRGAHAAAGFWGRDASSGLSQAPRGQSLETGERGRRRRGRRIDVRAVPRDVARGGREREEHLAGALPLERDVPGLPDADGRADDPRVRHRGAVPRRLGERNNVRGARRITTAKQRGERRASPLLIVDEAPRGRLLGARARRPARRGRGEADVHENLIAHENLIIHENLIVHENLIAREKLIALFAAAFRRWPGRGVTRLERRLAAANGAYVRQRRCEEEDPVRVGGESGECIPHSLGVVRRRHGGQRLWVGRLILGA